MRRATLAIICAASLAAVGFVVSAPAGAATARAATALEHNPCEFLDPSKPDKVATTDKLFSAAIGMYPRHGGPSQPQVGIVNQQGAINSYYPPMITGPDYQDGVC